MKFKEDKKEGSKLTKDEFIQKFKEASESGSLTIEQAELETKFLETQTGKEFFDFAQAVHEAAVFVTANPGMTGSAIIFMDACQYQDEPEAFALLLHYAAHMGIGVMVGTEETKAGLLGDSPVVKTYNGIKRNIEGSQKSLNDVVNARTGSDRVH